MLPQGCGDEALTLTMLSWIICPMRTPYPQEARNSPRTSMLSRPPACAVMVCSGLAPAAPASSDHGLRWCAQHYHLHQQCTGWVGLQEEPGNSGCQLQKAVVWVMVHLPLGRPGICVHLQSPLPADPFPRGP